MNWALPLSEYPTSILEEDLPLTVLAFLESRGLADEESLAALLGLRFALMNWVLLRLREDRLIEYGKSYVKMSDRGKLLLDRLDLSGTVLQNILKNLGSEEADERELSGVVHRYRQTSFAQYLNSVCTLRVWEQIANHIGGTGKQDNQFKHDFAMALLLRDLRQWVHHNDPSGHSVRSISQRLYVILVPDVAIENVADSRDKVLAAHRDVFYRALYWTFAIDGTVDIPRDDPRERYLLWVRRLNRFQTRSSLDLWFDEWRRVLEESSTSGKATDPGWLDRMRSTLDQYEERTSNRPAQCYWQSYCERPSPPLTDIIGLLGPASSLSDIATTTGLDKEYVRGTVRLLLEQCRQLLEPESTPNHVSTTKSEREIR